MSEARIAELKIEGIRLSEEYEQKVGYLYPRSSKQVRPKVTPEIDALAEGFNKVLRELAELENKPFLLEGLL